VAAKAQMFITKDKVLGVLLTLYYQWQFRALKVIEINVNSTFLIWVSVNSNTSL